MSEEILINVTPPETRVAVIENGVLQELIIERTRERGLVGNIYKGEVCRVLPGMQAAFIDIGLPKAAFIHISDLCAKDLEEKAKKALIAEYNEQLSEEYFEEQAEIMKEQAEEGSAAQEKIIETWSEHIADEYGAVQEGLEDQLGNTEISAHDLEKNWQEFEVLLDDYEQRYPAYTLSMDPLHEKKIIELNGQTYLISAHKNIADLTEEQKNEAKLAYKALSPQLEDRKKIHDQYRSLSIKNNEIQHTMLMLTNQLGKIQGALATIKLNQINPQMSQPLQPQLRPT